VLAVNKLLFFVNVSSFVQRFLVCAIKNRLEIKTSFIPGHTHTHTPLRLLLRPTVISNRWQLEDYSFLDCRTTAILFTSNSIICRLEICAIGRRGILYNASFLLLSHRDLLRRERLERSRKRGASEINSHSNEEDPSTRSTPWASRSARRFGSSTRPAWRSHSRKHLRDIVFRTIMLHPDPPRRERRRGPRLASK